MEHIFVANTVYRSIQIRGRCPLFSGSITKIDYTASPRIIA
jgi:hypothetical protein